MWGGEGIMSQATDVALSSDRVMMISSDGHATARMPDYRPYLPSSFHEEFDAFCAVYREQGTRINQPKAMEKLYDPEVIEDWVRNVIEPGRLEGTWDVDVRLAEMARCGVSAEVVLADFGLPFELYSRTLAALNGYSLTPQQTRASYEAYNRWLVDFCSAAPHRFAGMACVMFDDVDAAVQEIRWAKEAGLRGVLLPYFSAEFPVFHPRFDPVWATLAELGMPVNTHVAISGTFESGLTPSSDWEQNPPFPPLDNPGMVNPIRSHVIFWSCHQLLHHFIWGGVLERHPDLQLVFTEAGSGWVLGALESMDHVWHGALASRREIHDSVKRTPSEYFRRQCHLGASIFSRAEVAARREIGVDKMTMGVDFPHPEGTWGIGPGHLDYLQATFGAARVPADEARKMLGENAIDLWGFDRAALQAEADRIGPTMDEILKLPERDFYLRGDVHKPLR
jgi:predicted TIM-barrel fold metal-dependent hydrolase